MNAASLPSISFATTSELALSCWKMSNVTAGWPLTSTRSHCGTAPISILAMSARRTMPPAALRNSTSLTEGDRGESVAADDEIEEVIVFEPSDHLEGVRSRDGVGDISNR